jgi:hypothetical protein
MDRIIVSIKSPHRSEYFDDFTEEPTKQGLIVCVMAFKTSRLVL